MKTYLVKTVDDKGVAHEEGRFRGWSRALRWAKVRAVNKAYGWIREIRIYDGADLKAVVRRKELVTAEVTLHRRAAR